MENKFNYNGGDLFYQISGLQEPVVVLLHGFAEDSNIWNGQISFLQPHCRLLIPDLPGSGKSVLLQKDNITIEDYADCINALLDNEKIDSCILLGHSMGGYITLAFAKKYPAKLKAFGFVHSSAFADSDEKKSVRQKGIKFIEEHGVYPFLKNATPNLFSENYRKLHPEKISALIEQGKNFSKEALIQYYNAMMNRPDNTHVLQKSEVPVLFIIGSEDTAAPLPDLLKQVHLPKIAYIHIIQGAGHMSMWEDAEKLNNHLLAFIKDVL